MVDATSVVNSAGVYNVDGFSNDVSGYIGFAFDDAGTTYYGWAELTLSAQTSSGQVTVHRWAYEDSGASIQVGAVPESRHAAVGLGALALGAAGLRRWRRERRPRSARLG